MSGIEGGHTGRHNSRRLGAVPPCLSIDTQLRRPITNATGVGAILGYVGGTGEPRELVRCVGQRARSTPPFCLREGKKRPKHGRCRTLEWQRIASVRLD
ncbi:hypothetical protein KFK09_027801 [Dendrobium nobile]|uniref:Uncharacterized protein n=1 Tax=Dendrobium nobile TaxID=94219 RepID=A0A8T3A0R9_DENNO|nr:hypothetical protein KFK09_027801 [Dendrobium nobile]